jgi:phosphoglycolate phosphatase
MLAKKYFGDAFVVVMGASDAYPLKPDPTSALAICDHINVKPCECAYFGDSGSDMKTGNNLGASHTVGVLWGFRSREELILCGATDTAEHPKDILNII